MTIKDHLRNKLRDALGIEDPTEEVAPDLRVIEGDQVEIVQNVLGGLPREVREKAEALGDAWGISPLGAICVAVSDRYNEVCSDIQDAER